MLPTLRCPVQTWLPLPVDESPDSNLPDLPYPHDPFFVQFGSCVTRIRKFTKIINKFDSTVENTKDETTREKEEKESEEEVEVEEQERK